jgi:hypothetical protein
MKPHIKKINELWSCNGYEPNSPYNAYFMWQFKVTKESEYRKLASEIPRIYRLGA